MLTAKSSLVRVNFNHNSTCFGTNAPESVTLLYTENEAGTFYPTAEDILSWSENRGEHTHTYTHTNSK